MKRLRRSAFLSYTCLALVVLSGPGCTAIGFGVGAAIDGKKPPRPEWRLETLETGGWIRLHLRGGGQVEGTFAGLKSGDAAAYAERYAQAREESPSLPALGDGARVLSLRQGAIDGRLWGLDVDHLLFQPRDASGPQRLVLGELERVTDASGASFGGATLRDLTRQGSVPLLSDVLVTTPSGLSRVPLDMVSQIAFKRGHDGKMLGAVLGLLVDFAVVMSVKNGIEKAVAEGFCKNGCGW